MERFLMVKNLRTESPKYRVLVVDDEDLVRNLVVTFLSKLGHSCLTAVDGVDALDKLKGNKIDVVITDIKMPNMDGITLTSEILTQYPDLPIMVMTAFEQEHSAGIAISAGAREFIKKPFSLDEFAIRLHKMINDSEVLRRLKSGKSVNGDEDIQDLMNDLEEALKKK
jgi:two-component system chemotaxis response regulator CheY